MNYANDNKELKEILLENAAYVYDKVINPKLADIDAMIRMLEKVSDEIRKSGREIIQQARAEYGSDQERIKAEPGSVKCPRCYHHHMASLNFDGLCNVCVEFLLKHFPDHASIPFIKENLEKRGL